MVLGIPSVAKQREMREKEEDRSLGGWTYESTDR